MYPSDLVKLKYGSEVWMTVESVDETTSMVTTVWLDSDGKVQRSPRLPEEALEKRRDDDVPDGWSWLGQKTKTQAPAIRIGRNVRLIKFPQQTHDDATEMTVTGAKGSSVEVAWFDKLGELNVTSLPIELLYFRK